jgi:hypothetical protein
LIEPKLPIAALPELTKMPVPEVPVARMAALVSFTLPLVTTPP